MLESLRVVGDVGALRRVEVIDHAVVEREERGRSADFSTHVADRGHTGAGERLDTRSSVLDDSASSTLDGEDASNLENDI